MTQQERLLFLIHALLKEDPGYQGLEIPDTQKEQKLLLRSLMNVRSPKPVTEAFLNVQDAYLTEELHSKGIVRLDDLSPVEERIYLWQGDITRLAADAIVNAANSRLLGCFVPCHGCIDNAIHSAAGVQLRLACHSLMCSQKAEEPTGRAKITEAYNLPCHYVLHTVGPIVSGIPTKEDIRLLASCYRSCLELGETYGVRSLAFCCISTGEFHFPGDLAAEIAVDTVRQFLHTGKSRIKVVFNVFKNTDLDIYRQLLG